MESELPEFKLKAIGMVRSEIKQRGRRDAKEIISEIVIDPEFADGLDNLDEFSHAVIIFYFHETRKPAPMKVRPKYRSEPTPVGVFASRSPDRPNPIGKTNVRLLERRGSVLRVQGLDAIDGTPVIDIKPYIPGVDTVPDARVPKWMTES